MKASKQTTKDEIYTEKLRKAIIHTDIQTNKSKTKYELRDRKKIIQTDKRKNDERYTERLRHKNIQTNKRRTKYKQVYLEKHCNIR